MNSDSPNVTRCETHTPSLGGQSRAALLLNRSRPHRAATLSLVLLVVAVYWPVVGFDFVNWDDPWYVINNPRIKSWHPVNLYQVATEIAIKNYAPLTTYSYLVDHTLWGMRPGGYHLTNVCLHAINALLVYFLIVQLTHRRMVGWMSAALFALHPVHIESVAWIASRKGLLSGGFILASLICWLRPKPSAKSEGYGLLFFFAALLSKAIAVVVPFVVLMYDMLVRKQPFSKAFPRQIVPGFLALMLLLLTMTAQNTEVGGVRGHMALSKPHLLAVDSVIVWQYVGMLAWPSDLCVLYDPATSGIAAQVAVSLLGWALVAYAAWRFRRRCPMASLAAVAFMTFLLPVLNLFPITTLMNDRYLYLPSIPLFALAAGFMSHWWEHWQRRYSRVNHGFVVGRMLAVIAMIVAIGGYAQASRAHLPVWQNGMSLWSHASHEVPQLTVVQIQMANTLHSQGRDEAAVSVLERALVECHPDELDEKRIREKLAEWRTNLPDR